MRAVIYIRFSTPKQERGASRDRQLELCQQFCERHGWPVDEVIEDLGKSAWTGTHLASGELGKFAERVRTGDIESGTVLVVEKLDRLSRQETRTTLRWMEDLCSAGLTIATVDGNRIYDDAGLRADLMGVIEILMRAKLANDESQQKSERVLDRIRRNMDLARETGRVITARTPGWLVAKEDRSGFEVIEERAALVREIYEMAAAGKGARWIAKELNERGIAAWGKWRKTETTPTWEISSIKLFLSQPSVEGDYVPGFSNLNAKKTKFDQRIVGYYPRIVDAELVARARAQVNARKIGPRKGGRHTRGVANLFASVVVCGSCGNRMNLRTSGKPHLVRYWQCTHASRKRGCNQTKMFRYAPFEKAALDQILHLALDDSYFSAADNATPIAAKLAETEKAIADKRDEIDRLVDALARVGASEAVETRLVASEKDLRELTEEKAQLARDLEVAKGAVSPAEHLDRVREVRELLDSEDKEVRTAARLRVHNAILGLGCRVICIANGEIEEREIALVLPLNTLVWMFANDGRLLWNHDWLDLMKQMFPDLSGAELAERTHQILSATLASGEMNEGPRAMVSWMARLVDRYQAR